MIERAMSGQMIYIRYFPVKDASGAYLGVLEVTQEISENPET